MKFLPESYESPKSASFYMKLQEGENKIRVLSEAVYGWEDWDNKKPIRYTVDNKPLEPIDPKKPVKHFWAFIVFNYNDEQIQILQLTQASIMKSITTLRKDTDWGELFFYDIKINKTGEKMDTKYNVTPVSHKPLDPYIVSCFKKRPINLMALFTNEDPFSSHWDIYTPLALEHIGGKKIDGLSSEQVDELDRLLIDCGDRYRNQVLTFIKKPPISADTLFDLSYTDYARVKAAAVKKLGEMQSFKPDLQQAVNEG